MRETNKPFVAYNALASNSSLVARNRQLFASFSRNQIENGVDHRIRFRAEDRVFRLSPPKSPCGLCWSTWYWQSAPC